MRLYRGLCRWCHRYGGCGWSWLRLLLLTSKLVSKEDKLGPDGVQQEEEGGEGGEDDELHHCTVVEGGRSSGDYAGRVTVSRVI